MDNKYVFHVHTYRCGHATDETDEDYIKNAIALGADSITFTDHAPFPGNPFTGRMKYSQLKEYISSLIELKSVYEGIIDVYIGLEIEYLPSYKSYYEELKANEDIELMIIGQHHYEVSKGVYSFMSDIKYEYIGLFNAMIEGVNTGLFDVVAHPDRAFRKESIWTKEMAEYSNKLIAAVGDKILLEKNFSSMKKKGAYWEEFWDIVPDKVRLIYGCDAHSTKDMQVGISKGRYYEVNSSNTFSAKKNRIIKRGINGLILGTSGSGYVLENKGINKIL